MPSAKLAVAVGLTALSLSACGTTSKPEAGTPAAIVKSHQGVDDPSTKHILCLRQEHIAVRPERVTVGGQLLPGFQVSRMCSHSIVIGVREVFMGMPFASYARSCTHQGREAHIIA